MSETTTTTGEERAGDLSRMLLTLTVAVVVPPFLSVVYLVAAESLRQASGAEGYALATLDEVTFLTYAAVLAIFVVVGTWKSRGTLTRLLFAITSIVVSLVSMGFAFFSQVAP